MGDQVVGLLSLSVLIGMLLNLAVALTAFWSARVGFGAYLRERHSEEWTRLLSSGAPRIALGLHFDASNGIADFRRNSVDDLSDPVLASRRARANRLEQLILIVWLGLATWILMIVALLAAID